MNNYFNIFHSPDDLRKRWKGFEYFRDEKMGYCYACECGRFVKIGQTGKPVIRLSTHRDNAKVYGDNSIGRIIVTRAIPFHKDFERYLHLIFADKRRSIHQEYFDVSFEEVCSAFHETLNKQPFVRYLFDRG